MNSKSKFDCVICDDLIKAAQKGHMKSHEKIFRQFSPAVYNLALRITTQKQTAEDILQNTFINVLSKINYFRFEAPFGMWVRKITVNQVLMFMRKQKNQNKYHMSLVEKDNVINIYPSLEKDLDLNTHEFHADNQLDLQVLLAKLPLPIRTILWLKEVEGYTHPEIAEMTGKTASYSKSVVSRAYQVLRNCQMVKLEKESKEKR